MKLPALLIPVALLLGCSSTNTYEPVEKTAVVDPVLLNKVITDPGLNRVARVVGAREQRETEPYVVQVEIQNLTREPQRFLYQWEWVLPNGLVYQSDSQDAWRQEWIRGREIVYLEGVAPVPGVRDFKLKLTEPAD
ncbi:MAG: YcfL family protein [Planctomycetota bacterium]